MSEHFDVLIVGAGLSGIGAAYRLQTECPGKSFAILEAREVSGGTWELFRYPGIRSDSDMFTLAYPFRPWREAKAIADGPSILRYLRETADEFGIASKIRYGRRVTSASWSSAGARWTVVTPDETYTCSFVYFCSGYYRYDAGYTPVLPGAERFGGPMIHPQHWPEDLDYARKRIVVIGSGATAVTLVPALAPDAGHVTMLQRSPSWVINRAVTDGFAETVRKVLPERWAHRVNRAKNAMVAMGFYEFCQAFPEAAGKRLREGVAKELPPDLPLDPHFQPAYGPWDQRMCLVPDNDLFAALRSGKASVVTDRIETLTEDGIRLVSGAELPADLIVTATGLAMQVAGGARLAVDGVELKPAEHLVYQGVLLSDVPNLAICIGYTNSSWTLRSDMAAQWVCRLLKYLDRHGYNTAVAVPPPGTVPSRPLFDLSAGYIQRAADRVPKQAAKPPWRYRQNYLLDLAQMRLSSINGPSMRLFDLPKQT